MKPTNPIYLGDLNLDPLEDDEGEDCQPDDWDEAETNDYPE